MAVKPATSFDDQAALLTTRGLLIRDRAAAVEGLARINYYRLSGYALLLKNPATGMFRPDSTWEDLLDLYEFDRELKARVLDLLETLEIAFRTRLAYVLAHEYGPLGYMDSGNFVNPAFHGAFVKILHQAVDNSKEPFVAHHITKYGGDFPVWVAVELLSFSNLSKLFANMRPAGQVKVTDHYSVAQPYFESWVRSLAVLRNMCAHHARVYGKAITVAPKLTASARALGLAPTSLFACLWASAELCPTTEGWLRFVGQLIDVLSKYNRAVSADVMGFPPNWISLLAGRV